MRNGVRIMDTAPVFRRIASRLSALLAVVALQSAIASDAMAQEAVIDPPGRVARLSYLEGSVSLAPAESSDWADAVLNRPLTSGDRLWLDRGARAELEMGPATLHLDRGTAFGLVQLDDSVMLMSLTEGAAAIRVRTLAERETVQVETPNATVLLRRPGEYHLEVDADADRTTVRTRSGEAEVRGGAKAYLVRINEEGVFTGLDDLSARIGRIGPRTAFETWAHDRAQREEDSVSSRYVSRDVIGYRDLDDHGQWLYEPAYGYVWRPWYVAHGWAPYRFGRWVWILPWGWTWVDDARWGFAPFHYGRWAYLRHNWCWVPGPRHLRPVYAPAMVAWLGGAPADRSYSFGRGIGWFPLAPHEVYVPGYRHTPRYIRRVNLSNTVIADEAQLARTDTARDRHPDYRYRSDADAVTVAQRERFERGQPIRYQRLRVDDRELREWRDSPRPPAVTPDPRSSDSQPRHAQAPQDSVRAAPPRRATERAPGNTRVATDAPIRPSTRVTPARDNSTASYAPSGTSTTSQGRPSVTERSSNGEARSSEARERNTPRTPQSQPQSQGSRPSYQQQ